MRNKSLGDRVFDAANAGFMIALSVLFLYPFWNLISLSFTTPRFADTLGLRLFPQEFTTAAYKALFANDLLAVSYLNTILRTATGTGLVVFVTFFAAYALARRDLPYRGAITMFMLATLFFSGGLIPTYLNIRNLGLVDSLWSLILPGVANAWYITLARNFLMSFPQELEESALIDGANPLQTALRIIWPLSMPIIAVVALWAAVAHWNSWFDAFIYIRSTDNYVLQLLVRRIMMQEQETFSGSAVFVPTTAAVATQSLKAATIVMSILPIIAAYPFVQRYFIKGVMVGALKG